MDQGDNVDKMISKASDQSRIDYRNKWKYWKRDTEHCWNVESNSHLSSCPNTIYMFTGDATFDCQKVKYYLTLFDQLKYMISK